MDLQKFDPRAGHNAVNISTSARFRFFILSLKIHSPPCDVMQYHYAYISQRLKVSANSARNNCPARQKKKTKLTLNFQKKASNAKGKITAPGSRFGNH